MELKVTAKFAVWFLPVSIRVSRFLIWFWITKDVVPSGLPRNILLQRLVVVELDKIKQCVYVHFCFWLLTAALWQPDICLLSAEEGDECGHWAKPNVMGMRHSTLKVKFSSETQLARFPNKIQHILCTRVSLVTRNYFSGNLLKVSPFRLIRDLPVTCVCLLFASASPFLPLHFPRYFLNPRSKTEVLQMLSAIQVNW